MENGKKKKKKEKHIGNTLLMKEDNLRHFCFEAKIYDCSSESEQSTNLSKPGNISCFDIFHKLF